MRRLVMKRFCIVLAALSSESSICAGQSHTHEFAISSLSNFFPVRGFYTQYVLNGDSKNIVQLYQHIDQSAEKRKIVIPSYEPVPYELLSLVLDHEGIYDANDGQSETSLPMIVQKAETDSRSFNLAIDLADHDRYTQDKIFIASALFSAATYCRNRPLYSLMGVVCTGYAFFKSYQQSLDRLIWNTKRDALQRLVDDCRALSGTVACKTADGEKVVVTLPDANAYLTEANKLR